MSIGGASLELGMPSVHRLLVHSRSLKHHDPKLLIHRSWTFSGGNLPPHSHQDPLPFLQVYYLIRSFLQAFFEEFRSRLAARG